MRGVRCSQLGVPCSGLAAAALPACPQLQRALAGYHRCSPCRLLLPLLHPRSEKAVILITHQVEFVSQCDKVCIMDEGNCIYFGPWNAAAQQMMSRVLPASHLLAAAGSTEERKEVKKKGPAPSRTQSGLKLAATNLADNLGKAKRTSNSLPMSKAIRVYWLAGGLFLGCVSLFFFLLAQGTRQVSDFW